MTQRYKFRGIKVGTDKFVYGYLCDVWEKDNLAFIYDPINCAKYQVKLETVGQCIGGSDKNKKATYEGDTVRACGADAYYTLQIEYTERSFCMVSPGQKDPENSIWFYDYEIIGNIHQEKKG